MRQLQIILVCVLLAGCSFFSSKDDEIENWSAERLYDEGKDALDSDYFTRAIELYEKLQARYPFGRYAQQAQLDLAYAYYKQEESASAIAACDRFIKLYPTHSNVDYAYYLKGLSNFNQGKGFAQRFLPVDSAQRDPGAALQSFRDFTELVKRFPHSRYVADAQQRMMYLRNVLAQHEVNVANYYMRREAYVAAANRARHVVENYQRVPVMPEALLIMVKAYRVLELNDLADDALRVLELNYPNHPELSEARAIVVR